MVVNTWYSVSRILWKVDRACSIFNPDDVYHRYRSVTPLDAARVDRTILDLNNALSEGKRIYFEVVIMQLQFLQFSAVTRCSVQSPEEVREVRCPRTSYQVGTILVVGVVGVWPTTEGIRMYS